MHSNNPIDKTRGQSTRTNSMDMFIIGVHICVFLSIGLNIPIFRQFVCFFYLTFVPGLVFLSFLDAEKKDFEITLLLSVGLSIALLLMIGLIANTLYPLLGIAHPLSIVPLTITLTAMTLILFSIRYMKDSSSLHPNKIDIYSLRKNVLATVILIPLPIMAVVGAAYDNTTLLLIMIVGIIAVYSAVFFSGKGVAPQVYFLLVFMISISLLLHTSLVSKHVMGWDIAAEYLAFKKTLVDGHWNPPGFMTSYSAVDMMSSVLSITILPVIYSTILNMEGETLFKVVYPLLFSLVPLLLYTVFKSQTSKPVALLSSLFFVSTSASFYGVEPLSLTRQIVGDLFFMLSILSLTTSQMTVKSRRILFVIFSSALVVSHYSLSFIFAFYVVSVFLLSIAKNRGSAKGTVSIGLVVFLLVMTFSWYVYVSNPPFDKLTEVARNIADRFTTDIYATQARFDPGITSLSPTVQTGIVGTIHKILVYLTSLFVIIGIVVASIKPKTFSLNREFRLMAILSGLLLFLCIAVPNLAPALDFTRFYQITIMILALFFGLGGTYLIQLVKRFLKLLSAKISHRDWELQIVALVLIAFFAFQVGFINHISGGYPYSYSLDLDRRKTSSDQNIAIDLYRIYITQQEVVGAKWFSEHMNKTLAVYGDSKAINRILPLYASLTFEQVSDLSRNMTFQQNSYVYLGYINTQKVMVVPRAGGYYNISEIDLSENDKIYSTGDSEIYYTP